MNRAKTVRLAAAALMVLLAGTPGVQAQKYGGILRLVHREDPPSLSIHDEASVSTNFVAMPVYNNLVLFDPLKPKESAETIIGELAERWAWSPDSKALTVTLRQGVRWHDGRPFTAQDVKQTFDTVRGVSAQRLKLNPRRSWYASVREIVANGEHEVVFKLERPQPALLVLLASGYSPVHPAHVAPSELRRNAMGTGPFRLKSYVPEKSFEYVKNPDYFVRGRPYLDGIRMVVIKSLSSRNAAVQANQADMGWPNDLSATLKKQLEEAAPQLVFVLASPSVYENLLMNDRKPPFNEVRLRQAVALAMDRQALVKSVHGGVGIAGGGTLLPPPHGVWGIPPERMSAVPGMGGAIEQEREKARRIMRDLGYGPDKRLKVNVSTRALAIYVKTAIWLIDQLKDVWIEATLDQVETGLWYGKMGRRDYQMALNLTGVGVDDPDANLVENYACASKRNYSGYCNPDVERKIQLQSAETDFDKRLELAHQIDIQLQTEGARPILVHRLTYTAFWPYVRNVVMHQTQYSSWRFQEAWLDK